MSAEKEPAWRAKVESSALWIDAQPPAKKKKLRGSVELALEGGDAKAKLAATGAVVDASGRAHAVALEPEGGWDGALGPRAKKTASFVFDGPTLAAGAKARVRVKLADEKGGAREVEGAPLVVQEVQ